MNVIYSQICISVIIIFNQNIYLLNQYPLGSEAEQMQSHISLWIKKHIFAQSRTDAVWTSLWLSKLFCLFLQRYLLFNFKCKYQRTSLWIESFWQRGSDAEQLQSVNNIFSRRAISVNILFSQRDISVNIFFSQGDISVNIILGQQTEQTRTNMYANSDCHYCSYWHYCHHCLYCHYYPCWHNCHHCLYCHYCPCWHYCHYYLYCHYNCNCHICSVLNLDASWKIGERCPVMFPHFRVRDKRLSLYVYSMTAGRSRCQFYDTLHCLCAFFV